MSDAKFRGLHELEARQGPPGELEEGELRGGTDAPGPGGRAKAAVDIEVGAIEEISARVIAGAQALGDAVGKARDIKLIAVGVAA